jgi:hypothetical protein
VKLVQKPLYFIFAFLFFAGCNNQPLTSTLLVSSQSSSSDLTLPVSGGDDDGQLDIRADNQDVSAMVEDTDKIEISGSCNDLNRKKNRIIVEVFSGENENDTPYISNAISDFCQQTTAAGTGNGTAVGSECFWVTKGVGIIEDANIPLSRKSYPQCHNGRFSFAVRLGGVLQNPAPNGSRYVVRFKIRTLEGQIAESIWSRVYVTRKLTVPSIDQIEENDNLYFCSLSMSPARFNPNILYTLTRAQQGASTIPPLPIFTLLNSSVTTSGNSTYSYSDDTTRATNIISGVTYTYTLTSTEATTYAPGFSYSPALTQTSDPKTCTVAKPVIEQPYAPTNVTIGSVPGCTRPNCPTGPTCYLRFSSLRLVNPGINNGKVAVRWAYSTSTGWTGVNSDYNGAIPGANGSGAQIFQSTCGSNGACIANALDGDNLGANTSYYFAAQEVDVNNPGLRGKWSNEIECKPPSPTP